MFSLCQSENSNKSEAIVLIVVHATLPVPPMTSLCNPSHLSDKCNDVSHACSNQSSFKQWSSL